MKNFLSNLKVITLNLKLSPRQALNNSYQVLQNAEFALLLSVLMAIITGISNILTQSFLPIGVTKYIDKSLGKDSLNFSGFFGKNYKPNYVKYFFVGFLLFFIVLLICAAISYVLRTNMLKTKENFLTILSLTSIVLMPTSILFLIAGLLAKFSVILYAIIVSLGIIIFVIYIFQHLINISQIETDKVCFVTSVSSIIIIFIVLKLNDNSEIVNAILTPIRNIFTGGFGL